MRLTLKRSLIGRTALFGLLLPCLYFGAASATFLLRVHSDNASSVRGTLGTAPAPRAGQRFLIFSPHPDDETLGCGGLIQQAVQAGAPINIAFLTNGDGFRVAVERQFRELRIGPEHFVQFAALRQAETFKAIENLGVPRENALFLGYPDRGLLPLWNDYWSDDRLYRSPYTQRDRSPYALAYRKNASYCGQSLLSDVESVLRAQRPTDVYVTHPSDDHPDHTAASSFVTLALQRLREKGETWAKSAKLHYYIVHRGDWPVPQGMYKTDPLTPPADMASLDTEWYSRPLTRQQTEAKSKSILCYESQTAVTKRFLVSFARQTEIFGALDAAHVPSIPSNAAIAVYSDWSHFGPVVRDPVNDSLLRDFQGSGDVRAVYAARDGARLHLRIVTHQPLSSRVSFRVRLRYFGDPNNGSGGSYTVTLRPGGAVVPATIPMAVDGNALDFSIPLRDISYARRLALNIDTLFAGIQVDRTGYRFLKL